MHPIFRAHCARFDTSSPNAADKAYSTLRARLALSGFSLSRSAPGDGRQTYFATRRKLCRQFADLAAVELFAMRVGAPH